MNIQFCDVCNNLLYLCEKNNDGDIMLRCRHDHVKVIPLVPEIPEETISVLKNADDYDFPNKEASRKIVRNMLDVIHQKGLVKPFHKQKVLILTHVEGLDLKQILLPLGYKKENITIIERDKDVYDQIVGSEFFNGCDVKNMHLERFKKRKKFDLIYLDFKSNLSYAVLDILQRLLIFNSRDGTVFYINLQMAREIEQIVTMYYDLENELMENYDRKISMKQDEISKFGEILIEALEEAEKRGSSLNIKFNGRTYHFKDEGHGIDQDLVDFSLDEMFEQFENDMAHEWEAKHALESRKNYHVLRQKALKLYVKTVLNAFLLYTDEFSKKINNNRFSINLDLDAFSIDDLPTRRKRLIPIMRYLGKTLTPIYFTQFIYKNKANTPFLNTFFVLKSQDGILNAMGFNNFGSFIAECFMIFYLKGKNMIRENALRKSLLNFTLIEEFIAGNIRKDDDVYFFDRDHQNDIRERLNMIRQAYVDLKSLNLLRINDEGILNFQFLDSSMSKVRYNGDYSLFVNKGKRGMLRKRTTDASVPLLVFYLILRFLNLLEKEIGKNVEIDECKVIDVDGKDIDEVVNEFFPVIFKEDQIVTISRGFKTYISRTISRIEMLGDIFEQKRDVMQNIGIRLDDLMFESESMLSACKKLFKQEGGSEQVSNQQQPNHMSKDELKDVIRDFVSTYYETVSVEIASMVNEHVERKLGYNPGVTDAMIRAHKYWHRVNVLDKQGTMA